MTDTLGSIFEFFSNFFVYLLDITAWGGRQALAIYNQEAVYSSGAEAHSYALRNFLSRFPSQGTVFSFWSLVHRGVVDNFLSKFLCVPPVPSEPSQVCLS